MKSSILPDSLKFKFKEKRDGVYHAISTEIVLSNSDIQDFCIFASNGNRPIYRLCLNPLMQTTIHEMIIIHPNSHEVRPNAQKNRDSVTYTILEGELTLDKYCKNGNFQKSFYLSSKDPSGIKMIRVPGDCYRGLKNFGKLIFLETSHGPFSDNDTHWL